MQIVRTLARWDLEAVAAVVGSTFLVYPRDRVQWLVEVADVVDDEAQGY